METILSLLLMFNVTMPASFYEDASLVIQEDKVPQFDGEDADGAYSPKTKTVYLYKNWDKHALLHELGHHVCITKGTPPIFGRGSDQNEYVSLYATYNAKEDCAETFAYYYQNKGAFRYIYADPETSVLFKAKLLKIRKWERLAR